MKIDDSHIHMIAKETKEVRELLILLIKSLYLREMEFVDYGSVR